MAFTADSFAAIQAQMAVTMGRLQRALSLMPDSTTGRDASGAVGVDLDRDGAVAGITFRDDWRDALEPDTIDAAVLTAAAEASSAYEKAAADARDTVDALPDSEFAGGASAIDDDPLVRLLAADKPFAGTPRPVIEIAEDFIAMPTPSVDELLAERAAAAQVDDDAPLGPSFTPRVEVELHQARLQSTRTDAVWAETQSGASLTAAFATALDDARAAASTPVAGAAPDTSRELLAEVLQVIKDLTADQTGETR